MAAVAVLVGATLQSALGFGFALVASPALLLVLEPAEALTVLLVLGPISNVLILLGERRRWHVRGPLVGALLAGALPGLAVGSVVLRVAGRPLLQVLVGVLVLATVALQLGALQVVTLRGGASAAGAFRTGAVRPPFPRLPLGRTAALGVLVGMLTTSTGTNGPPMVLWLTHLGLRPAELRDTLFVTFTSLSALGLLTLVLSGSFQPGPVGPLGLLGLIALVLVGRALGWAVFRRLPETLFRRAGLTLVAVLGLVSLYAGLTG